MKRASYFGLTLALISMTFALTACTGSSSADVTAVDPPNSSGDPDLFVLDHAEQFPLSPVETRMTPEQLRVTGMISPDVSLMAHVTSLSGGRVVEVRTKLGDEVQKGQVLVLIHSQDLAQAISDYRKAQADELLARKALDRSQDLYSNGAVSQKELQESQDAEAKAKIDIETSIERIRIFGKDVDTLSPMIEVQAPISGTVVEQNVTGGEGVKSLDNSPNLFTVADLSRVWLLCDVYENSLAQVHVGDFADVRLNAYPDRPLKGRISDISPILDPTTRTAKVRIELDNKNGLLRPNMFAVATFTSQTTASRMVVPASALVRLHDKDWVFVSEGGNRFRRVAVQAGSVSTDGLQIAVSVLKPGDAVVTNALQFVSAVEQK